MFKLNRYIISDTLIITNLPQEQNMRIKNLQERKLRHDFDTLRHASVSDLFVLEEIDHLVLLLVSFVIFRDMLIVLTKC